jgi:hypothetical protein
MDEYCRFVDDEEREMKCERCGVDMISDDAHAHLGQKLCEDCYMDALSPSRACDPWAVYSAKTLADASGGKLEVNEKQKEILKILAETGGLTPAELFARTGLPAGDLERELAALRHMEKLRAELRRGEKYLVPW